MMGMVMTLAPTFKVFMPLVMLTIRIKW